MKTVAGLEHIEIPTAATIGMFDGVHAGHRSVIGCLLEEAWRRNLPTAVITFSRHPRQVLCPECNLRLLMEPQEKLSALSETGVDYTVMLDFDRKLAALSAREFISRIRRDYGVVLLVAGYDHRFGHNPSDCFEDYVAYGREEGVEVVRAPELTGDLGHVSSSEIRRRLAVGEVAVAGKMLTRPYRLGGIVVDGERNGRRIGFPTANIDMSSTQLVVPGNGVYAVKVTMPDGSQKGGMLNIGTRPTVSQSGSRSVEVNIFDFSGDLYGLRIDVDFVEKVRDERRMDGLEALSRQLTADRQAVEEILKKTQYENR